jgi:cardiolipin synthase
MFHCKLLVVDEYLVSVGSTNFDNRSFKLNDEANLNIYDRDFAKQQTAVFADDLKKSQQVTLEAWMHRPFTEKLIEKFVPLLDTQL